MRGIEPRMSALPAQSRAGRLTLRMVLHKAPGETLGLLHV